MRSLSLCLVLLFSFSLWFPTIASAELTEAEVEAQLKDFSPSFFSSFERNFPSEFSKLTKKATKIVNGSGTRISKLAKIRKFAFSSTAKIRKRHAKKAAVMPDRNLKAVVNSTAKLISFSAKRGGQFCNAFLNRGGSVLSKANLGKNQLIINNAITILEAAGSANRTPQARAGKPSEDDWTRFVQQAGLTENDYNLIGKTRSQDVKRCKLMVRFLNAVSKMPGAAGKRIRAETVKDLMAN